MLAWLAWAGNASAQAVQALPAEVVVHVFRDKQDPSPFIEFVATVRQVDGRQVVDLLEVENRPAIGSFMIISGVQRAGEIGVKASDKYEISFSQVSDYRIYEKAVMDFLRRLPLPEQEIVPEPEIKDFTVPAHVGETDMEEEEAIAIQPIPADTADLPEVPVTDTALPVPDSGSVLVHVHRSADDIEPFREFILSRRETNGETHLDLTEVRGMQPKGGFLILNGFDLDSTSGVQQSAAYEAIAYNLDSYTEYESAVLDHMLSLSRGDFLSDAPAALPVAAPAAAEPAPVKVPAAPAAAPKKKAPSARELRQQAKQLEKAKFKAPKYKNKYGKRQAKKMSSRMGGKSGKKTRCPSLRGY